MFDNLLSLTEHPVDVTLYTPHVTCMEPMLFVGEKIKSAYDHARVQIKSRFETVRLNVDGNYFYGVQLEPNQHLISCIDKIVSVPHDHDNVIEMYRNRLKLYGLSCDDCWGHLSRNIFPIDIENVSNVSINSTYMNFKDMFTHDESLPWFTQHAQPKLFVFTNR